MRVIKLWTTRDQKYRETFLSRFQVQKPVIFATEVFSINYRLQLEKSKVLPIEDI